MAATPGASQSPPAAVPHPGQVRPRTSRIGSFGYRRPTMRWSWARAEQRNPSRSPRSEGGLGGQPRPFQHRPPGWRAEALASAGPHPVAVTLATWSWRRESPLTTTFWRRSVTPTGCGVSACSAQRFEASSGPIATSTCSWSSSRAASPGLLRLAALELELAEQLGREVDLRTAADLSRQFRDEVSATARVLYDAA